MKDKTPHRPRDINANAGLIARLATGEAMEKQPRKTVSKRNNSGKARAASLTPEQRTAIARKAAKARWGK